MTAVLTTTGLVVLAYVLFAWTISVMLSRADIVDPFWGPGFLAIALTTVALPEFTVPSDLHPLRWALLAMVCLWALRLGTHLLVRWWHEPDEDRRYAAMRAAGTERWWLRSLVTVFLLQGILMWLISFPLQWGLHENAAVNVPIWILGAGCWGLGFCFESIGDWQLTRFRRQADSGHRVLDTGLWRYTRHPNYFGDFAVWWGFFLLSVACGAPLVTAFGPVLMSIFLMKFSGVGMLEKDIRSRRPGYEQYVRTTNAFWPGVPRSRPESNHPDAAASDS